MSRKIGRGNRGTTRGFGVLVAMALVLSLGAVAEAQLAKQGTYSTHFGWYATGKTFEFEKDHVLFVGEFSGAVFNDTGGGFMHGTSWVCPGMNELLKGISTAAQGYCIATDKDGDKAFLTWKGHKSTEPNRLAGDFQWTGGSGKYTGIKGNNTFEAVFVTSNSGYALHKGEWQLP